MWTCIDPFVKNQPRNLVVAPLFEKLLPSSRVLDVLKGLYHLYNEQTQFLKKKEKHPMDLNPLGGISSSHYCMNLSYTIETYHTGLTIVLIDILLFT